MKIGSFIRSFVRSFVRSFAKEKQVQIRIIIPDPDLDYFRKLMGTSLSTEAIIYYSHHISYQCYAICILLFNFIHSIRQVFFMNK